MSYLIRELGPVFGEPQRMRRWHRGRAGHQWGMMWQGTQLRSQLCCRGKMACLGDLGKDTRWAWCVGEEPWEGAGEEHWVWEITGRACNGFWDQPGWAWLKAKGRPWIQGRPPQLPLQPRALGRNSSTKLVIQRAAWLEPYSLGPGAPFSETSYQLLGPPGLSKLPCGHPQVTSRWLSVGCGPSDSQTAVPTHS